MNFTLYIDESGDFETNRGQWVLSGMLFADSFDSCERHLTNKLKDTPKELGLNSMKDFHLTEFRRDFGHETAVKMASKTISKLEKLPFSYYCLAAINNTKSALSTREKTYRLMLADVLSLCDVVIGENQVISKLDLVVASRTIDGELQTSISNINQDIIKSLPTALEVGLATKGLIQLIGKHIKVHMDYANNSWGLICADFLANLNYHNKRINEKKLLEGLNNKGKYFLFESFGSYEIRKANIAERDKDYILSLFRWLIIRHQELDNEKSNEAIQRLIFKLLNMRGTSGNNIGFEAVLDRIWREYNVTEKYGELANILVIFETALQRYSQNNKVHFIEKYLFRMRNLMLIVDNHLGRTINALHLSKLQLKPLPSLALNPENFHMILDFKISEIEIYVNSLDFEKSYNLSQKYYALIESYKDVWQLMIDNGDIDLFDNSRASIKAEMASIRCKILYSGIHSVPLCDMPESFLALDKRLTNDFDKSRYQNYKIMHLIKQNKLIDAVFLADSCLIEMDESHVSPFDLFWSLRAINDALLNAKSINIDRLENLIRERTLSIDLNKKGHPFDLLFRELALFEFQLNNKSMAQKYIRKSKNSFNLANSEVAIWLNGLIEAHEDYINGNNKTLTHYLKPLGNNVFALNLIEQKRDLEVLLRLRFVSPY